MFGLILIICIYLVLGFMLAWIAGVIAREDVEVKTGAIILVLTGIISFFARLGLDEAIPDAAPFVSILVNFGVLVLLLNLIAKLSWKHSALIALIYTILLTLIFFGLAACMSA